LVKLKIFIGLGLLSNKALQAQTIDFPNNPKKSDILTLDVEMEDVTTMCYEVVVVSYHKEEAKFKGGQRSINQFVKDNVIYPEQALKEKVYGDVAVNVTINEDGTIINSRVVNGKGCGLDEEAIRLIKLMPPLKPGEINGKKTIMNKTIVIHFELPQK